MRRYLFGIFAAILAMAAVAFTAPEKKFANLRFRYNPPSGSYDITNVQDRTKWQYVTDAPHCNTDEQERACEILVPDNQVDGSNHLKSTFNISASEHGSTGVYYVTGMTSGTPFNGLY